MELKCVDECARPTNEARHPIAYSFEPVRAEVVLEPPTEPDYESDYEQEIEMYLSALGIAGGAYVGFVSQCPWIRRVSAAKR